MKELQYVNQVDLQQIANIVGERIDYSKLHELGWYAMEMRCVGYLPDMTQMKIVIYFDGELNKVVARHE